MDLENQILIEENQSLTNRVSTLESKLDLESRKLSLALELIKGLSHLVPNLLVKFENELERIDNGEDTDQRKEYL